MNICVTVNSRYMRYAYIMLQSLYDNNERGSIDLYVLHRDFTERDKKAIEGITEKFNNRVFFIWVDPQRFQNMPINLIEKTTLSLEIFFRLLIPEILVMLDKVLMLDVDIIINGSVQELYDTELENVCLAAAPNMCTGQQIPMSYREWYPKERSHWTHFNTGVLLWNLKYIREKYPNEYIFNQAQKSSIRTMAFEEETFNVLFGENEIRKIDPYKWNFISTYEDILQGKFQYHLGETEDELRKRHVIIHFLGRDPWGPEFKNKSYCLWWSYAKKTPYYYDIRSEQRKKPVLDLQREKWSLEYKGIVLEKLFRLKGTGQIKEILRRKKVEHIFLYGAGLMADLFYVALCADQIQNLVEGVFDNGKEGRFHGILIESLEFYSLERIKEWNHDRRYTFIITPSYEIAEIKRVLVEIMPNNIEVFELNELLE